MENNTTKSVLSRIGLGCGSMKNTPGTAEKEESLRTMHAAIEAGILMFNTADFYGTGDSESAIGEAISKDQRKKVYISDKFGALMAPDGSLYGLDVHPNNVKNHLAHSLKRLRTDYIDLYQPARVDLAIPVEETIGAVADMVKAGYVKEIGMTQIDAETLRRANKVHHISYLELEYSLFNREPEMELMETARELGVKVVAFGTLAHGLLSGNCSLEHAKSLKMRASIMSEENLEQNLKLVENIKKIAEEKNVDIPQLVVAWMLNKHSDITPLVGTSKSAHILHMLEAEKLILSDSDMKRIEAAVPKEFIAGQSFRQMQFRNGVVVRS